MLDKLYLDRYLDLVSFVGLHDHHSFKRTRLDRLGRINCDSNKVIASLDHRGLLEFQKRQSRRQGFDMKRADLFSDPEPLDRSPETCQVLLAKIQFLRSDRKILGWHRYHQLNSYLLWGLACLHNERSGARCRRGTFETNIQPVITVRLSPELPRGWRIGTKFKSACISCERSYSQRD